MKRAFLLLGLVACTHPSTVTRVYEGRVVEGRFIAPEAYEAYLKGVIAEEAGDLPTAARAYEEAVDEDGDDPEAYARLGAVRCKLGRKADSAFGHALRLDRTYAPALAAKAECEAAHGRAAAGIAVLDGIPPADREAISLEALYMKLAAQANVDARARAIALTVASADAPAAWDALIGWGRAKADPELFAVGLEGLLRAAPTSEAAVEVGVLELVGLGQTALARRVAAALADAPAELGVLGPYDPTVARLAVDEAILRDDRAAIERRTTHAHIDLGEAAARALLLERPQTARGIADGVLAADPTAACAEMTAIASSRRIRVRVAGHGADACVLVVAERLAGMGNNDGAKVWARRMGVTVAPQDPVTGPVAVDLAARGIVAVNELPTSLRIELAARRREAPPPLDATVDTKHALLWNALHDPASTETRALAQKLRGGERDPIVGFAFAKIALAGLPASAKEAWAPIRTAFAASPTDPLILAVAVELAKSGGHTEELSPARARLLAFAQTPAERALATE